MQASAHKDQATDPGISRHISSFYGKQVWQRLVASAASASARCLPALSWVRWPSALHREPPADESAGPRASDSPVWSHDPTERRSEPHPQPDTPADPAHTASSRWAGRMGTPPSLEWCRAAWAEGSRSPDPPGSDAAHPREVWSWWTVQEHSGLSGAPLDPTGVKTKSMSTWTTQQSKVSLLFLTLSLNTYISVLKVKVTWHVARYGDPYSECVICI